MDEPEPTREELLRQQRAQEEAERAALAESDSDADAQTHERRAEKAHYLHEKLAEQARADRDRDA